MKQKLNQKLIGLIEYYNLININLLLSNTPIKRKTKNFSQSFQDRFRKKTFLFEFVTKNAGKTNIRTAKKYIIYGIFGVIIFISVYLY